MSLKKERNNVSGWLIVNKPVGVTSTKVVAIVKRYFNAKKVGHAGTLDPLACGVLPIAFGEATKVIEHMMDAQKEYGFTIRWGVATSTDDKEGEVIAVSDKIPSVSEILAVLPKFIGNIEQVPPKYSAIKVSGKRAYDLARGGLDVQLKKRNVVIKDLQFIESEGEVASFCVVCSKGTYVRALARDIAEYLGTKGHVVELERRKVGKFGVESAILLEKFDNKVYKAGARGMILPIWEVLDGIPVLSIDCEQARVLRHGQKIVFVGALADGTQVVVKTGEDLVALGKTDGGFVKPTRVFNI